MKNLQCFLIISILLLLVSCTGYRFTSELASNDVEQHLRVLASDELQGRLPATPGDLKTGEYIHKNFRASGLTGIKQDFTFLQTVKRGDSNFVEVNGRLFSPELYSPLSFSSDTVIEATIVFAGYGITIKADSFDWDDYRNLDVKGKWVMALRQSPEITGSGNYFMMGSEDRDKAMLAADNGAAGLILVSGLSVSAEDVLEPFFVRQSRVSLPVFQITRKMADSLLKNTSKTIISVEKEITAKSMPVTFETNTSVKARTHVKNIYGVTSNHYTIIEGADPILNKEYIVIGAHHDHLGTGGKGSSSRRPDTIDVHNGADDNASGISAILELAANLQKNRMLLKRSVIIAAFGGEEMGLLGSKYFISHLPVELSSVVAMINLDMVGRLDMNKGLQIGGTGTSAEADSLIAIANKDLNLKISKSRDGSGPSDHSSFYAKNIPVFFLTTGAHTDYHTPEDDIERINIQGIQQVSVFAQNLTMGIASEQKRLTFQESGPRESSGGPGYRFRVTLGFMPDFSDNGIKGVRVEFVSKGKAAERGGIKNGDIITAIDGLPVTNIYDYMYRLSKLTKNQIISVELLRDGKKEVLVIQL